MKMTCKRFLYVLKHRDMLVSVISIPGTGMWTGPWVGPRTGSWGASGGPRWGAAARARPRSWSGNRPGSYRMVWRGTSPRTVRSHTTSVRPASWVITAFWIGHVHFFAANLNNLTHSVLFSAKIHAHETKMHRLENYAKMSL